MSIITLYNHKGGVSKTTTTFNLAWLLADEGHRVLIVDADPQCNITEIALAGLIEEQDQAAADSDGAVGELPGNTIKDILQPRLQGDVAQIDIDSVHTVEVRKGMDLIRGSVDLSELEDDFAEAHVQRFATKTHLRRNYVAFSDLISRLKVERKYDYVFIDVGPSSGALTRSCFLSCDCFFVPVAPDRFSVQAIGTVATIVSRWIREHQEVYEDYRNIGLPIALGRPLFLGAIVQSFKVFRGRAKKAYQLWIDKIPERITENLVPALAPFARDGKSLIRCVPENYLAAEIPDFGTLAPLAQRLGKAVFAISKQDTTLATEDGQGWKGGTWIDATRRMSEYRAAFAQIATRLDECN
jgi:chromosome partitioning protein